MNRCTSGQLGCDGQPITAADCRPGDRIRVMSSLEKHPPTIAAVNGRLVKVRSAKHGAYSVDVAGACSCILEPAS